MRYNNDSENLVARWWYDGKVTSFGFRPNLCIFAAKIRLNFC